jgi:hypothetical protein
MDMRTTALPAARETRALLNAWQRDLPLVAQPYDALGAAHGLSGAQVRAVLQPRSTAGRRAGSAACSVSARAVRACCALRAGRRSGHVARIVNAEPVSTTTKL